MDQPIPTMSTPRLSQAGKADTRRVDQLIVGLELSLATEGHGPQATEEHGPRATEEHGRTQKELLHSLSSGLPAKRGQAIRRIAHDESLEAGLTAKIH